MSSYYPKQTSHSYSCKSYSDINNSDNSSTPPTLHTDHIKLIALATLGLDANATDAQIRKTYKRLSLIKHPDRGGTTLEFQNLQNAYSVLIQTLNTTVPAAAAEMSSSSSSSSSQNNARNQHAYYSRRVSKFQT
jgi:hypothetical protein